VSGASAARPLVVQGGPGFQVAHQSLGWRVPVDGGQETEVFGERALLVAAQPGDGLYLSRWHPVGRDERWAVEFLDLHSGQLTELFRKDGPFINNHPVKVSPDEEWILYSEIPAPTSELMLVENFR